ncbi:MAG: nitrate ABC transporter substrate-binding protein [Devosia sp. 67-54]|uniref:ABC transporter substrate-binding protein n=1 Tax=unclassified Devosia TaxID=196773 RepID=UPI00095DB269|nr:MULTISPECIES: ABC transporter substrate-binding protein [unclassified Devosia]MBN9305014.1 ABC transporter substrate-binding protein [Devosia sp.]OJX15042.1 MAG: nitrate ABC transporter substrate-binding protein [Devosia sp. 67-54]
MKTNTIFAAVALSALLAGATGANAADALKLKLKWVPQAQFAGYYVAAQKGYYKDANLDVTIDAASTDVSPVQALVGGTADVVIDWAADALSSREKGVNLVNIAQPFKKSGLLLTCRKDMGITGTADFKGKTLGVWFGGNEYPFYAFMAKLNLPTNGGADGVTVLKQGFNVDPLLQKQAACVSTMTYNEYGQVLDGGLKPDDLVVFNYRDEGVGMLEDGLYVLQDKLADAKFKDVLVRFVRASMKGWEDAVKNPDEAAQIVVDSDPTGAATIDHQKYMMGEVAKLIDPAFKGALDANDFKQTVATLLANKSGDNPAITKEPDAGAYTTEITDAE